LSRIRSEYVNAGKVRFVYKHFAILGPESNRSAEASECAAEQGQFWDFHDVVFADQVTNHSSLDADQLVKLAGTVGLDTTTFRECLDAGRCNRWVYAALRPFWSTASLSPARNLLRFFNRSLKSNSRKQRKNKKLS
jgi:protein-disulfide isomerase